MKISELATYIDTNKGDNFICIDKMTHNFGEENG